MPRVRAGQPLKLGAVSQLPERQHRLLEVRSEEAGGGPTLT
jgi:hypothetical protein